MNQKNQTSQKNQENQKPRVVQVDKNIEEHGNERDDLSDREKSQIWSKIQKYIWNDDYEGLVDWISSNDVDNVDPLSVRDIITSQVGDEKLEELTKTMFTEWIDKNKEFKEDRQDKTPKTLKVTKQYIPYIPKELRTDMDDLPQAISTASVKRFGGSLYVLIDSEIRDLLDLCSGDSVIIKIYKKIKRW